MMIRRVPIIPTVIVALAIAAMIGLGIWQLQRAGWKADLLAHYEQAAGLSASVPYPDADPAETERVLYRHSRIDCRSTAGEWDSIAGRNRAGEVGYVHVTLCDIGGGRSAYVQAGWSQRPQPPEWNGGEVSGHIAPYNKGGGARLIADPPVAGLIASARPDPKDLPNNHASYAMQWFFFAMTALAIYILALVRRARERDST